MESTFRALCEASAATWEVPALAVGELVAGETASFAIGCDPSTRFRIASITKPFTATLALRLLDLDAATDVWPIDVRVRHLLSHTSGYGGECGDLHRFGDGDEALAAAVAELPSVRRFVGTGEAWSYANTGYWLAGWLCAVAAGTTYEAAVVEHVLRPARLEATAFGEPELPGSGPGATTDRYPRARRPSGGLVSNVPDLLAFARWQLATAETQRLRVAVAKPTSGVYGLGFGGERVAGVEVWGHNGSYGGFESTFLLLPDRDAAFVGLTSSGRGGQALKEIEDAWFERVLGARRRVPQMFPLDARALANLAGTYANDETSAAVVPSGAGLSLDVVENGVLTSVEARPIGERTFEIVGGDLGRHRFDFPLPRFLRYGSRLLERTS